MGEATQVTDQMLAKFGSSGSLEELKEERISLNLARGRIYDILSHGFSYPWNRKFFRPKSLLEPMDVVLLGEEDWKSLKAIVDGYANYLPNMTIKQVQSEYINVFGHAVSMECPPMKCSMALKVEFSPRLMC